MTGKRRKASPPQANARRKAQTHDDVLAAQVVALRERVRILQAEDGTLNIVGQSRPGEDAIGGGSMPQARDLTAREREVISRLLLDVFNMVVTQTVPEGIRGFNVIEEGSMLAILPLILDPNRSQDQR